ncbi:HupE/UreJ family protein [Bacillus sp. 1P10SD]|uniref:HupE/UreJ family protein n=1 Tax=Bacillus sp. 1P10SD TaxID=3132265 RepID=UPI0039A77D1F
MFFKSKRLFITCLLVFMIVSIIQPHTANAHSGSVGYSEVTIEGNKVTYDLFLLADLLGGLLDLDKDQDGYMNEDEIQQSKQVIEQYIFQNLSVINNGFKGQVIMKDIKPTTRANLPMFRIELEYVFEEPVEEYEIAYSIFYTKNIDINHQNFLTVHIGDQVVEKIFTKNKNIFQGNAKLKKFYSGNKYLEEGKSKDKMLGFWDYVVMGMKHIWSGIDHMLFIFGLLLTRGTYRDYLKTLTAFTVGHCITLALAATGTLLIPSSIIEPLIALSIVYVAVENIFSKNFKWRWVITFLFGLIHGFGFAELLIGKLETNIFLPLFSFNLGVEIGQIVVLMIMLPFIWYLQKIRWQMKVVYSLSSIISVIGLYWFMDRVL